MSRTYTYLGYIQSDDPNHDIIVNVIVDLNIIETILYFVTTNEPDDIFKLKQNYKFLLAEIYAYASSLKIWLDNVNAHDSDPDRNKMNTYILAHSYDVLNSVINLEELGGYMKEAVLGKPIKDLLQLNKRLKGLIRVN
jgi:hypothetical protein